MKFHLPPLNWEQKDSATGSNAVQVKPGLCFYVFIIFILGCQQQPYIRHETSQKYYISNISSKAFLPTDKDFCSFLPFDFASKSHQTTEGDVFHRLNRPDERQCYPFSSLSTNSHLTYQRKEKLWVGENVNVLTWVTVNYRLQSHQWHWRAAGELMDL